MTHPNDDGLPDGVGKIVQGGGGTTPTALGFVLAVGMSLALERFAPDLDTGIYAIVVIVSGAFGTGATKLVRRIVSVVSGWNALAMEWVQAHLERHRAETELMLRGGGRPAPPPPRHEPIPIEVDEPPTASK